MISVCIGLLFLLLFLAFYGFLTYTRSRHHEMARYKGTMFAHRGYHNKDKGIPENSMAAFRAAVDRGYGIELDLHITRDGKLAVFHDDSLERMCQVQGQVESFTMAELKEFKLLDSGEEIPEFGEVLSYVHGQVPLLIELKIPGRDTRVCKASYEMLKTYTGAYLVQSFNTLGLWWYKKHAPEVLRGQLSSNLTGAGDRNPYLLRLFVKYLLFNILGRPDFLSYKFKDLPNLSVSLCRWLWRIPMAVWTLRTEKDLGLAKKQYDMYIFEKKGEYYER